MITAQRNVTSEKTMDTETQTAIILPTEQLRKKLKEQDAHIKDLAAKLEYQRVQNLKLNQCYQAQKLKLNDLKKRMECIRRCLVE